MLTTLRDFFKLRPDAKLSLVGQEGLSLIGIEGKPHLISDDTDDPLPFDFVIKDKGTYFRGLNGEWWGFSESALSQIAEVENELLLKEELTTIIKALTISRKHDTDKGNVIYPPLCLKRIIDPILSTPNMGQVVCYYAGRFGTTVLTTPAGVKYVELSLIHI